MENITEIARAQWVNNKGQFYIKNCKWSPDGTCLLTLIRAYGMHVFELPSDMYACQKLVTPRISTFLKPAVFVPDSGLIWDYDWYPGMNSSNAATCCWLSSGNDGLIKLWDAYTGQLRCTYLGYNVEGEPDPATSAIFSADGKNILSGHKKTIRIFETSRPGCEYTEYPISSQVSTLVASRAQQVVAMGNDKGVIDLFLQNDRWFYPLYKLDGHKKAITSLAFSADGTRLYSGAAMSNEITCWDLRVPGKKLFFLTRPCNTNQKITIDLSADDKWFVSGGSDGTVQMWDVSGNHCPAEGSKVTLHKDCCNGVSFHPTKPILATSSGQHHKVDPMRQFGSTPIYENAVCMWWMGPQQKTDIMAEITHATTTGTPLY